MPAFLIIMKTNVRAVAADILYQVLEQGQSLSSALPKAQHKIAERDAGLLQEICFGTLRVLPRLEACLQQLLEKPLSGKQRIIHQLLLVGLYQLLYTRIPPHAAVGESVNAVVALKRPAFRALVNGVLRRFQREQDAILALAEQKSAPSHLHPQWLVKRLQNAYPEQWSHILDNNNQKPPMWLRVNRQHHSAADYLALLAEQQIDAELSAEHPDAILLHAPVAVTRLPGFADGWVTVQDLSAQHAALLLEPQNGELILDVCAAPGGKTTHILEMAPHAQVVAVDVEQTRLNRVAENLERLGQQATLICGDGRQPRQWWPEGQFDRILLDAPCSATGVIRRHPDIKWLRRAADIDVLTELQKEIFDATWDLLKPGGTLIYATCSVLPEENHLQIEAFLQRTKDAELIPLGKDAQPDWQLLPDSQRGDGFFYAKLRKTA